MPRAVPQCMAWRTHMALVVLARPALAEERVLYCTETGSQGFFWEEGKTEVQAGNFKLDRYTVKVLSEKVRTSHRSQDEWTFTFNCTVPGGGGFTGLLVCNAVTGPIQWVFRGNNFVRAYSYGPPVGGDNNIRISYGTCTGF